MSNIMQRTLEIQRQKLQGSACTPKPFANIKGPFCLDGDQERGWTINDLSNTRVVNLSAILVDGSGTGRYPNNEIQSRDLREEYAKFIVESMNRFYRTFNNEN